MRGKRVLVVEDALLIALEIQSTLVSLGCEIVGPVSTLEGAVSAARSEALDGAILDVNLGGEAVYPAADELLKRGVPLIFSTGYDANAGLPSKYDRLPRLEKPFGVDELTQLSQEVFVL